MLRILLLFLHMFIFTSLHKNLENFWTVHKFSYIVSWKKVTILYSLVYSKYRTREKICYKGQISLGGGANDDAGGKAPLACLVTLLLSLMARYAILGWNHKDTVSIWEYWPALLVEYNCHTKISWGMIPCSLRSHYQTATVSLCLPPKLMPFIWQVR